VLELVEGATLASRLAKGPLPLSDVLRMAHAITKAIEAAHNKGIVHRDLKPTNIAVTPDGVVKVLDFGLAKPHATDITSRDQLETCPPMLGDSDNGHIVGTPAYMSPEQVRGHPLDKRVDIWGFGCILYEMIAGRTAFPGVTLSDSIASVLEREPDWRALPHTVPESLRRVLRRCLEKDPKRRLHDIADVRLELDEALADVSTPQLTSQAAVSGRVWMRGRATRLAVFGGIGVLLAAVVIIPIFNGRVQWAGPVPAEPGTATLGYRLVPVTNDAVAEFNPSWSPDGKALAYVAEAQGAFQIFARALSASAPVQLTPTQSSAWKGDPFGQPMGPASTTSRTPFIRLALRVDSRNLYIKVLSPQRSLATAQSWRCCDAAGVPKTRPFGSHPRPERRRSRT
jgi:eukaryotic-like serine/threonine-protein kinase